jgi:DHA2 family multidrug resistance protein-like MFS transporter
VHANAPPRLRAGPREWVGLAVLALPCLLYAMDLTVLNLAVPQLSADLRPSSAQLLWIVDIYGFLVAGSLVTMGTLGDRIGRRRLLLIGAAAFGIAILAVILLRRLRPSSEPEARLDPETTQRTERAEQIQPRK